MSNDSFQIKKTIIVDHEACVCCEECIEACTCKLLEADDEGFPRPRKNLTVSEEQDGDIYRYDAPSCSNCRECVLQCPNEAIEIQASMG